MTPSIKSDRKKKEHQFNLQNVESDEMRSEVWIATPCFAELGAYVVRAAVKRLQLVID